MLQNELKNSPFDLFSCKMWRQKQPTLAHFRIRYGNKNSKWAVFGCRWAVFVFTSYRL